MIHERAPARIAAGAPREEEFERVVSAAALKRQATEVLLFRIVVNEVVGLVVVRTSGSKHLGALHDESAA
ncbi:MAG: hypothetical protein VX011_00600, partial [Candidatus Thermoplasmatota archaeon]|nr:hypothetical protein [Candidatus Thermoplasmatota archaeon]